MAGVQLGVMAGARVTATVARRAGSPSIDAALAVNAIAPEGFADHGPFDVILELVGAPNLAANLDALAPEGRICIIGIGAGAKAELDLRKVMTKRARILGSTMRARPLEEKGRAARLIEQAVLPGFVSGDLSVPVTATFALIEEAAAAYERFQAGSKLGKVILEL